MRDINGRARMALGICAALAGAWMPGVAAAWTPERPVELVAPVQAGGGLDQALRAVEQIWREHNLVGVPMAVVNKPGGGQSLAATYIYQAKGDAHRVLLMSSTLISNPITGRSKLRYTDFTVLGQLYTEYMAVSVNSASPFKTGKDIVARMKQAPDSLAVAVGSALGATSHLGIAIPLKLAGVDIRRMKSVVFPGAGSITNVLGGHVDVATGALTAAAPYWRSGQLRILAVTSPERLGGEYADIPTWREQGIEGVVSNWRFLLAPPGLSAEQIAFWSDVMRRTVQLPEWKQQVDKNQWVNHYIPYSEAGPYLEKQEQQQREILTDLGLAK
jgi:putative tricarboxylic transport membrane protein